MIYEFILKNYFSPVRSSFNPSRLISTRAYFLRVDYFQPIPIFNLFSTMTSNNLFFNTPEIFTNKYYQIWSVRMNSYFETYDLLYVVMEERSLQTLLANPITVQMKALSKEFSDKIRLLRVFFKDKTKRRKRKKKRKINIKIVQV